MIRPYRELYGDITNFLDYQKTAAASNRHESMALYRWGITKKLIRGILKDGVLAVVISKKIVGSLCSNFLNDNIEKVLF